MTEIENRDLNPIINEDNITKKCLFCGETTKNEKDFCSRACYIAHLND